MAVCLLQGQVRKAAFLAHIFAITVDQSLPFMLFLSGLLDSLPCMLEPFVDDDDQRACDRQQREDDLQIAAGWLTVCSSPQGDYEVHTLLQSKL